MFAQSQYYDQQQYYTEAQYPEDHKKVPIIPNNKCNNYNIIINGKDNPTSHLQGIIRTGMTGENYPTLEDQWRETIMVMG
ncbi:MAG: hypothetical protein MRJ93_13020 [Nitrososphaeraceae archaeon]|nr:hypothetical protein [Nitrososphaeraceae archaeon]